MGNHCALPSCFPPDWFRHDWSPPHCYPPFHRYPCYPPPCPPPCCPPPCPPPCCPPPGVPHCYPTPCYPGYGNSYDININGNGNTIIVRPRMFKALATQSHEVLPNITGIHIKNIEFDHGHFIAPGSIFKIYFSDDTHVKIKVDDVDSVNHIIKFTTFEGSILGDKYDKISSVAKFEESGDKGTILKLCAQYHNKDNHEPTAAEITAANEKAEKFCRAIEEYLIAHPNVCA